MALAVIIFIWSWSVPALVQEEVDVNRLLSFEVWKEQRALKDQKPVWDRDVRDREVREEVGRLLECVGDCRIYGGPHFFPARYRSSIREGDDVVTMEDSYLWIYLFDGTLVRLSPHSSVSLKEINIGIKENFLHARLNSGNILWFSRHRQKFKPRERKETDSIFLPLSYYEANVKTSEAQINEEDLSFFLEDSQIIKSKYKRLNALIEENNKSIFKNQKPTYSYLVFPNGTLWGKNLSTEFIVLMGNKSYFKLRGARQLGLERGVGEIASQATFYFRGFENQKEATPDLNLWYEVGERGLSLKEEENYRRFSPGEFLTSNIPTILAARELMARKYSSFAHASMDAQTLSTRFGYRQWTSLKSGSGGELELRLNFLKNYTRRLETMNLLSGQQLRRRLEREGEALAQYSYGSHFYSKALQNYYLFQSTDYSLSNTIENLNSRRNPFWRKIHGIR